MIGTEANNDLNADLQALGDWRLSAAAWISAIDGKAPERPLSVRQVSIYHAGDIHITYPTPSAAAMHLNASWRCATRSQELKEQLKAKFFRNDGQPLQMVFEEDACGPLFDLFEEMIGSVSGACSAVEAFCNRCIAGEAKGPLTVKGRKGKESKSAEDVVRFSSLEDKLKRIVPDLMGVSSLSGKEEYDRFLMIKNLRDSVTHFKSHDEAQKAGDITKPTVLNKLFFMDQYIIPESAMAVIRYLARGDKTPRWLSNPRWVRPS